MARRGRPIRASPLPETAAAQRDAALVDAMLEQPKVRTLGVLPLLPPILERLGHQDGLLGAIGQALGAA